MAVAGAPSMSRRNTIAIFQPQCTRIAPWPGGLLAWRRARTLGKRVGSGGMSKLMSKLRKAHSEHFSAGVPQKAAAVLHRAAGSCHNQTIGVAHDFVQSLARNHRGLAEPVAPCELLHDKASNILSRNGAAMKA
jgi:hypothetical protein